MVKELITLTLFFITICSISCTKSTEKNYEIDQITYEDLIEAAALTYPHYYNTTFLRGDYKKNENIYDTSFTNSIVQIRNSINSSSTGLTMNLHYWELHKAHCYPNTIIYITNNKGFHHIIPFFDEQYCLWKSTLHEDSVYKRLSNNSNKFRFQYNIYGFANSEIENHLALETHLNYVLYQIEKEGYVLRNESFKEISFFNDTPDSVKTNLRKLHDVEFDNIDQFLDSVEYYAGRQFSHLNEFNLISSAFEINSKINKRKVLAGKLIEQITSILKLKKIELSDTMQIYDKWKSLKNDGQTPNLCNKKFEDNYKKFVSKLKSGKYLYYHCYEGLNGLWCFSTNTDSKGKIKISAEFENFECYFNVYY
jgi:hypothetical protein